MMNVVWSTTALAYLGTIRYRIDSQLTTAATFVTVPAEMQSYAPPKRAGSIWKMISLCVAPCPPRS